MNQRYSNDNQIIQNSNQMNQPYNQYPQQNGNTIIMSIPNSQSMQNQQTLSTAMYSDEINTSTNDMLTFDYPPQSHSIGNTFSNSMKRNSSQIQHHYPSLPSNFTYQQNQFNSVNQINQPMQQTQQMQINRKSEKQKVSLEKKQLPNPLAPPRMSMISQPKRSLSHDFLILLNNALISIIRKLDYSIEIIQQKKLHEMQFYYISTIQHIHQMHFEYDFACEWSKFIQERRMNGNKKIFDNFHFLTDLTKLDELNNLDNFNYLNQSSMMKSEQFTNEEKINIRNRIIQFIQHIQIHSMIEIIEKETKYIFNYKTSQEKSIEKAERSYPISIIRDQERRVISLEQFIRKENDDELVESMIKEMKRRSSIQKSQRLSLLPFSSPNGQNGINEQEISIVIFSPIPTKTISHSMRRDREQNEDDEMINKWNLSFCVILMNIGYQIIYKNITEYETTFVYIESMIKDAKRIEVFNEEIYRENPEKMKRIQFNKLIEIVTMESPFGVVYCSNEMNEIMNRIILKRQRNQPNDILPMMDEEDRKIEQITSEQMNIMPRYIYQKNNQTNSTLFYIQCDIFYNDWKCKEFIEKMYETQQKYELFLCELNNSLINYLRTKEYSFNLIIYQTMKKRKQRYFETMPFENEFEEGNEMSESEIFNEMNGNEEDPQKVFVFVDKIYGKNKEILFDINTEKQQWYFKEERYHNRKTIQLYKMAMILEQENGMRFQFIGINSILQFNQIINRNNHVIQIDKFFEKFRYIDETKNMKIEYVTDELEDNMSQQTNYDFDENENRNQMEENQQPEITTNNEEENEEELMELLEMAKEEEMEEENEKEYNEPSEIYFNVNYDDDNEMEIEVNRNDHYKQTLKTMLDISNELSMKRTLCDLNNALINVFLSMNYIIEIVRPITFEQPIFWEIKTLKRPNKIILEYDRDYHMQKSLFLHQDSPIQVMGKHISFDMKRKQIISLMELLEEEQQYVFITPPITKQQKEKLKKIETHLQLKSFLPTHFALLSHKSTKQQKGTIHKQKISEFITSKRNIQLFNEVENTFKTDSNIPDIELPSTSKLEDTKEILMSNSEQMNLWNQILIKLLKEYGYTVEERHKVHHSDNFVIVPKVRKDNTMHVVVATTHVNRFSQMQLIDRQDIKMMQIGKMIEIINVQGKRKYQVINHQSTSHRENKFRILQYIRIVDKKYQLPTTKGNHLTEYLRKEEITKPFYKTYSIIEYLLGMACDFNEYTIETEIEKVKIARHEKLLEHIPGELERIQKEREQLQQLADQLDQREHQLEQIDINPISTIVSNNDNNDYEMEIIPEKKIETKKKPKSISHQREEEILPSPPKQSKQTRSTKTPKQLKMTTKKKEKKQNGIFTQPINEPTTDLPIETQTLQLEQQINEEINIPQLNRITRIKLYREDNNQTIEDLNEEIINSCTNKPPQQIKRRNKKYIENMEIGELQKRFITSIVYILITRCECSIEYTGNPYSSNFESLYITSVYNGKDEDIYSISDFISKSQLANQSMILKQLEKHEYQQLIELFEKLTSIRITITTSKRRITNVEFIQTEDNLVLSIEEFFDHYCRFDDIITLITETRKYIIQEIIKERNGTNEMKPIETEITTDIGNQTIIYENNSYEKMFTNDDISMIIQYADLLMYQESNEMNLSTFSTVSNKTNKSNKMNKTKEIKEPKHTKEMKEKKKKKVSKPKENIEITQQEILLHIPHNEHHQIIKRKRNEEMIEMKENEMEIIECYDNTSSISEDYDMLFDSSSDNEEQNEYEDMIMTISEEMQMDYQ